jgi:hypothetical protein
LSAQPAPDDLHFWTLIYKNYFLNRARDNTFFNALGSADKGYTPLNLSDNIISDIVKPNIPDTIANIKQKSLHGRRNYKKHIGMRFTIDH